MSSIGDIVSRRGGRCSATLSLETIFYVYEDMDKNEGRGAQVLRYSVASETDARQLAEGLGPMGSSGRVDRVDSLILEIAGQRFAVDPRSIKECHTDGRGALVAAALRKLTEEERRALLGR